MNMYDILRDMIKENFEFFSQEEKNFLFDLLDTENLDNLKICYQIFKTKTNCKNEIST